MPAGSPPSAPPVPPKRAAPTGSSPRSPQSGSSRQATSAIEEGQQAALIKLSARRGRTRSGAAAAAGAARKQPGQIGKYRILRRLHRGRVSQVLLAETDGIGGITRRVAIKCLRPELVHAGKFVRGLLHEERATGALKHPNLVVLLDSMNTEHGYAMVLEHLPGWDVRAVAARLREIGRVMPPAVALTIAHAAAGGLHYLHGLQLVEGDCPGLVHHDVSPSNLMVSPDGFVKLIDFGDVTLEGMGRSKVPAVVSATTPYTAPEVAERAPADRRSDLFSLGVVIYELTCGRVPEAETRPARGGEPAVSVVPPSAICHGYPQDVEALLLRLLDPDVKARFATAEALQYALETICERNGWLMSARRVAVFLRDLFEPRTDEESETRPLPALASKPTTGTSHPQPRPTPSSPQPAQAPAALDEQVRSARKSGTRRAVTEESRTRIRISRR